MAKRRSRRSSRAKRAVPAAFKRRWAEMRAKGKKATRRVARRARRVARSARRAVRIVRVVARRRRRRGSTAIVRSFPMARRRGHRRTSSRGGAGRRGFFNTGTTAKALIGAVVGIVAANQLAPRIAAKVPAGGAADFVNGTFGQIALKAAIGVAGAVVAGKMGQREIGAGFALGAIAEPVGGYVRSKIAEAAASGQNGLGYYDGMHGLGYYDGMHGLGQTDYGTADNNTSPTNPFG